MDLETLEAAVLAAHDPATPQTRRAEAYAVCERAKSMPRPADTVAVAQALFARQQQQQSTTAARTALTHFALLLLEHTAKERWMALGDDERAAMVGVAADTLFAPPETLLGERLLREKVAAFVVEVAKRMWPQRWPGLMQLLSQAAAGSPAQQETALFVFRGLPNEARIFTDSALSRQRKEQIISGLKEVHAGVLSFITSILVQLAEKAGESPEARSLCIAALDALSAYVDWVPIETVTAEPSGVHALLTHLQRFDALKQKAADALLQIVTRSNCDGNPSVLLFPLRAEFLNELVQAAQKSSQLCGSVPLPEMSELQTTHYFHFVRVVEVIAFSGCLALREFKRNKTALPDTMAQCFQVMRALFDVPNAEITALVVPFLTASISSSAIDFSNELAGSLLEAVLVKATTASLQNRDDFTERPELSLATLVANKKPLLTVELMLTKAGAFLSQRALEQSDSVRKGVLSIFSPTLAIAAKQNRQLLQQQGASAREVLRSVVQSLLELTPTDEAKMLFVVEFYRSFSPVISELLPEAGARFFSKGVELFKNAIPGGIEAAKTRQKCLAYLIHLALAYNMMGELDGAAQMLVACNAMPEISFLEKTLLKDLVLALCHSNRDKQAEIAAQLLSSVSGTWSSPEAARFASSLEEFLSGIFSANPCARMAIPDWIETALLCSKRVSLRNPAISQQIGPALPHLFGLARVLADLFCSASARASLPAQLRERAEYLLRKEAFSDNTSKSILKLLLKLRSSILALLGTVFHGGAALASLPGSDQALCTAFFAHIEEESDASLLHILGQFVDPFSKDVNAGISDRVSAVLQSYVVPLQATIEKRWAAVTPLTNVEMDEEDEDANEEIERENALRVLTRRHLAWLDSHAEVLSRDLFLTGLGFAAKMLSHQDSQVERLAQTVCNKALRVFAGSREIAVGILGAVLSSCTSAKATNDPLWPTPLLIDIATGAISALGSDKAAFVAQVMTVVPPDQAAFPEGVWSSLCHSSTPQRLKQVVQQMLRTISHEQRAESSRTISSLPVVQSAQALAASMASHTLDETIAAAELERLFADKQ